VDALGGCHAARATVRRTLTEEPYFEDAEMVGHGRNVIGTGISEWCSGPIGALRVNRSDSTSWDAAPLLPRVTEAAGSPNHAASPSVGASACGNPAGAASDENG
jgi:hypothetical protein